MPKTPRVASCLWEADRAGEITYVGFDGWDGTLDDVHPHFVNLTAFSDAKEVKDAERHPSLEWFALSATNASTDAPSDDGSDSDFDDAWSANIAGVDDHEDDEVHDTPLRVASRKEKKQHAREIPWREIIGYDQERYDKFCDALLKDCLLYTSPSPRDRTRSRMPSSA